jgi:fido (protein-threonine AMPylation protein)
MGEIRDVVETAMKQASLALFDEGGNSRMAPLPYEERREAFVKAVAPLYTTVNAVHPTKMYCSAGVRAFVTGLARQHGLDMDWGLEGTTSGQRRDANITALRDGNLGPMQELLKRVCRERGAPGIAKSLKASEERVRRLLMPTMQP